MRGDHKLREIHLLIRDDGTADLFIIGQDRHGRKHHYHRVFAEGEEIGDLRKYTDGPTGEAEYLKWPNRIDKFNRAVA